MLVVERRGIRKCLSHDTGIRRFLRMIYNRMQYGVGLSAVKHTQTFNAQGKIEDKQNRSVYINIIKLQRNI